MGKEDLIEAARLGNYPACEKILSSKPKKPGPFASLRRGSGDCNTRDSSGYTALHYAALNGHKDIVELLITHEASCNSADEKGSSPLHLASWAGHSEIVDLLLTLGPSIANVNLTNSDKETALHSASQYGHLATVKLLLEQGADPNIKNCREETPLDLAALYGRTETVRQLLESHPELVGPYTAYGGAMYCHTPLHLASRNGHKDVVDIILSTGFDINVRTARGTALHEAGICGKIEVVAALLEAGINMELRDQDDRTVLEIMDELKTPRTREVIHLILDHMGIRRRAAVTSAASTASGSLRPPHSPYDNVSLTQSLDESYSIDLEFGSAATSRASSRCMESPLHGGGQLRPRAASKSVEDIVENKRISSLSMTSGCSDCTTATLQGAKSYGSSFFSGDDTLAATPKLLGSDDTSLSSDGELSEEKNSQIEAMEIEGAVGGEQQATQSLKRKKKSSTLTRDADPPPPPPAVAAKPSVPVKPAHIRPGLKPVKIPTVDDKVWPHGLSGTSTAPRKPPRRNVSMSPKRIQDENRFNTVAFSKETRAHYHHHHQGSNVYSTKAGSKSFDELDDLLADSNKEPRKAKRSSLKKKEKAKAKSDNDNKTEGESSEGGNRHSCDELMMTRSLYHPKKADGESGETGSKDGTPTSGPGSSGACGSDSHTDCQRCLLNTLSNRTMSLDCDELINSSRFISQRQYKRKLRKDCPSYATMGRRGSKRSNVASEPAASKSEAEDKSKNKEDSSAEAMEVTNAEDSCKITTLSKTTFKLRSESAMTSEDDLSLELMEIPLSPTHYDQPPTPDHEPPSAFEAETAILSVLDNIRKESKRMRRSVGTEIDTCYLWPLGKTKPTVKTTAKIAMEDKDTTMDIDMQPFKPRGGEASRSSFHEHSDSSSVASSSVRSHLRLENLQMASAQTPPNVMTSATASTSAVPTAASGGQDNASLNSAPGSLQQGFASETATSATSGSSNVVLTPFDEKEEWHKISEIINSFGSDIGKDVKKSITPHNSPDEEEAGKMVWKKLKTLREWLTSIGLEKFENKFVEAGYDNLDFLGSDSIDKKDLKTIGVIKENEQKAILDSLAKKGHCLGSSEKGLDITKYSSVDAWLASIGLSIYSKNFSENLFTSMERVAAIWDDELTSILDIEKIGHRKRILLSLAGREGLQDRFGKVKVDSPKPEAEEAQTKAEGDAKNKKKEEEGVAKTETECKSNTGGGGYSTGTKSRKKKAAPQPPGKAKKSGGGGSEREEFLAFKVRYYAKRSGKDFKGTDTTKSAIESSKKSKGGRQRFLVLSEKDVKILKRDAKEQVATHEIGQVCCVVRDAGNQCIFGYVTTTESGQSRNTAHVFTTDSPEKATEILSVICEGFGDQSKTKKAKKLADDLEPQQSQEQDDSPSPPSASAASTPNRFRSDHIVSRMKLFFQGTSTDRSRRSESPNPAQARRKRGGSVDNLLDDFTSAGASVISTESKKKSVSQKNLNVGGTEEVVKITNV